MAPADDKTKDAKKAADGDKVTDKPKAADEPKKVPLTLKQELKASLALLQRGVELFEPRFSARVLRTLTTTRRKLSKEHDGLKVLREVLEETYPKGDSTLASLLSVVPTSSPSADSMDVDAAAATVDDNEEPAEAKPPAKEVTEIVPEQNVYLRLLSGLVLLDAKDLTKATDLFSSTVELIQKLNRRSLDHLAAKVYFYLGRVFELQSRDADLRPLLLAAHRTATLRHDEDLQSTLINLLLRNYFNHNLLDQADKLVSKSTFPESAGNAQLARYLYYLGRIRAVQLNYSEAHENLQQAIRRAPSAHIAPGFIQTAYKFFIVVDLLMGNIPERSTFRLPVLKSALVPYFQIVQAVRVGDLSAFQTALSTHGPTFRADGTLTLILRLRHNVIKTGLAQIAQAYSKISLRDICTKLQLEGEEDAEYIVAKAIRDGVVPPGVGVDHAKGWLVGSDKADVLETAEPRKVFGKRIDFCLQLHNESVKAMRFPLNAHRKDLNSGAEARERERELVTDIAEGNVDEDDEMDF